MKKRIIAILLAFFVAFAGSVGFKGGINGVYAANESQDDIPYRVWIGDDPEYYGGGINIGSCLTVNFSKSDTVTIKFADNEYYVEDPETNKKADRASIMQVIDGKTLLGFSNENAAFPKWTYGQEITLKKDDFILQDSFYFDDDGNEIQTKYYELEIFAVWKYSDEWVDGYYFNEDGTQTYSATGAIKFNSDNSQAWFEDSIGWYPVSDWELINSHWIYFDKDGYAVQGWQQIDGAWYYFDFPGETFLTDCWIDGYYIGEDGVQSYSGVGDWYSDANGWYYMDSNGWYPQNSIVRIDNNPYFFKADGYMAQNEWCADPDSYQEDDENAEQNAFYYHFGADGQIDGHGYYEGNPVFNEKGGLDHMEYRWVEKMYN